MRKKAEQQVPFSALGVIMAIGIVYGDIGTSPLYVMKAVISALPVGQKALSDSILGVVSCVIWTLTLQTTLKYVLITLKADNKGEGGILSLFALLRSNYKWTYLVAGFGAATLLADGIITPSITVITSIEGLHALLPVVPIIPVTVGIIVALFLIQPFGTGSLGKYFGPVMVGWFGMLAILGLTQVVQDLGVFAAFNSMYAIRFLISTPQTLLILGAVFLCTTGAEALYADLGHCGLKNIQVSWIFVKLALIVNYLGQAAWIINNPSLVTDSVNPFFAIMPSWFSFVGVIMATVAAIIASQALISGSFTIVSEAISLKLWPNVNIKYPSDLKGQMYIPSVNFTLMVLCCLIVIFFQSSANLEAAYGLSITLSMLMTTILLNLYLIKKGRSAWFRIPMVFFFCVVEGGFLLANLQKFSNGGYATLLIAGAIFAIMIAWYSGFRIKNAFTIYESLGVVVPVLLEVKKDESIPKAATHLVYMSQCKKSDKIESKIIHSLLHKQPKRADTYWFVSLFRSDNPYEFIYDVVILAEQTVFRINIYAGFKLGFHVNKYLKLITMQMELDGLVDLSSRYPALKEQQIDGDFKFVVVDRVFKEIHLPLLNRIGLYCYERIKRFATSDSQILDLDPSVVTHEMVPYTIEAYSIDELKRLLTSSSEKKE